MADRMSNVEIEGHFNKLTLCLRVLMQIPTAELLHEFSLNDTLGPLFDPTGWMRIHENASKNEQLIRALATFQAEAKKAWPELALVEQL